MSTEAPQDLHDVGTDREREGPNETRDRLSFEDFYRAHQGKLLAGVMVMTRNRGEAEEIAQEAFLQMWRHWSRVRRMENLEGYLFTTALRVLRQWHRRAARAARRLLPIPYHADPLATIEDRDQVVRAILGLSSRQRMALLAIEWFGFDSSEAGSLMGVRPGTVRMLVSQAKNRLQQQMGDGSSG